MKRFKIKKLKVVLVVLIATITSINAEPGRKMQEMGPHHLEKMKAHHRTMMGQQDFWNFGILKNPELVEKLKLSEKQIKDLETLKYEMEKKKIELSAQLKLIRLDTKTETEKDNPDIKKVSELIDKAGNIQTELKKNKIITFIKAKQILTKEQINILKNFFAEERVRRMEYYRNRKR